MKKSILLTAIMFVFAFAVNAQNDTMYVMKAGVIVGKYNINTQVDSVIFYRPQVQVGPTVTDADGNEYQTVIIGTQVWMAENLKTTKYADGTTIPLVTVSWGMDTTGYCWYDNDSATYAQTYGALYNAYTINANNGLCPTGWHVPRTIEWQVLTDYLGGEKLAGGKLKESGSAHWFAPNTGATNETGFTALSGGQRDSGGAFSGLGSNGYYWIKGGIHEIVYYYCGMT